MNIILTIRIRPLALVGLLAFLLLALLPVTLFAQADACADPANPIVAENCQPGSDGWIVRHYQDDIEGFAYPPSVNLGENVDFFVNTGGSTFTAAIYRSGYYGGQGGRLVTTLADLPGGLQPACHNDRVTGLTSCSNWRSRHTLSIPTDWVSGVYMVKLIRPDTGGENYLHFVVRDDARRAPILAQQSLFTYHAYNAYGGKSNYDSPSGYCLTDTNNPRASHVSLLRPYPANVWQENSIYDQYIRAEYPLVRWLEQQGYDVSYTTNLETHRAGLPGAANTLLNHQVFLSMGHDEYWTQAMTDAITAARDAGVHIGIFSANTSYWRVRLVADPWNGTPDSVIVTYKTTESGPVDPSGHHTGTYRDRTGVNAPEAGLLGVQYIGDNIGLFFPMRVTTTTGQHDLFRGTDLQTMPPATYINIGPRMFGWEWDAIVPGVSPDNIEIIAATPLFGHLLTDDGESNNGTMNTAIVHTTRYQAASGAYVFAAGTIQWGWALGAQHITPVPADPYIAQLTYNLLADMGVEPATPAAALVLPGEDDLITSPPSAFLPLDTPAPVIQNLRVETGGDFITTGRSMTVRWETDIPALGQVYWGVAPGKTNTDRAFDATYRTEHALTITGSMYPLHTYYIKVGALSEAGQAAVSDEMRVTMPFNLIAGGALAAFDLTRYGPCWVQANPVPAAGLALGGVAVLLGLGLLLRRWWRRRRAQA